MPGSLLFSWVSILSLSGYFIVPLLDQIRPISLDEKSLRVSIFLAAFFLFLVSLFSYLEFNGEDIPSILVVP